MNMLSREGRTDIKPMDDAQRAQLVGLVQHPGWAVLLDLMESECVKQETNLINTPNDQPAKVLAEHNKSQAMWQFFVRLQKQVQYEINELSGERDERGPSGEMSDEEILDPMR